MTTEQFAKASQIKDEIEIITNTLKRMDVLIKSDEVIADIRGFMGGESKANEWIRINKENSSEIKVLLSKIESNLIDKKKELEIAFESI